MRPKVLLLDEPSSGIAQRETEALGELIAAVKAYLDATLIVIEHDMPLIIGISDRILAMEAGARVVMGPPTEVTTHPRVIESYLGGDLRTIQRSGVLSSTHVNASRNGSSRCSARTKGGSRCSRLATEGELCRQHANVSQVAH
jgi:ABC-type sulfate/molybdate transport systems ATPase subunit